MPYLSPKWPKSIPCLTKTPKKPYPLGPPQTKIHVTHIREYPPDRGLSTFNRNREIYVAPGLKWTPAETWSALAFYYMQCTASLP